MRERLITLGLILAALIVAGLGGKAVYDYRRFRTLNDEGRIAAAIVRELKPSPARNWHGREGRWVLSYSFATPDYAIVEATVGVPKERAGKFRVGQRIDVVYAPGEPSLTALDPEQAWAVVLHDERVLIPYLAILMVLAWNALERYRRRG
ncbi:DUF3592 domain-containing protein [Hyphomicrobium sp.]|uniref:DUF3592 domain-containing protein n=1 Tax=Hyphomicrobium sp. TaxID=82 RepID=UPI00132373D6|nr:DUF3592 domain-containing protein [Hyphomicrobium sp.]KAB2937054.1 MAG: hypothetical protein F9K20_20625 [Hyphomicrobium sp.]